jgi:FAD binding domain/Berberine and berberine like
VIIGSAIESLREAITGRVIDPSDRDYDDARRVWNAAIDARPAVIARCLSTSDVQKAIEFALDHRLEIAVRGGSHSTSGASVVDAGMVIDLSSWRQVAVDPATRRARATGGALLADLDAATQQHGLAVPAGLVSHTGIGGLTLGGGMGWLSRIAGLSIDNLVAAQVVTVDGRIVRAAQDENADLFWALRGGGGNFGVVTEFEFQLLSVGPTVQFGLLFWGLEDGPEVLRLARDTLSGLPREINIVIAGVNAPPADFVPEEHRLRPGYALLVAGFGDPAVHDRVVNRLALTLPPLFQFVSPLPYVGLQQLLDEANAWGSFCYEKGAYIEELSDGAIEVITRHVPGKTSPLSLQLMYRLDGAYSEVDDDATAFGGERSARYGVFIVGVCDSPDLLPAERAWVREFWDDLQPHAAGIGAYVNTMSELDVDRVRATYGPGKYRRLAQVKAAYDPDNVFHRNANVAPAET